MAVNLNTTLLLRRGEFSDTFKLLKGEPGYHTVTKEFKIGDGETTWGNLAIANKAQIDALIKVTDDKVVALSETVSKLDETYATDAELKAAKEALEAALLDKVTYEAYVEAHKDDYTNTQIDEAVAGAKTHAETKISEFNTATVAPIAADVATIKGDYTTAAQAGTIAQGKIDEFKTSVVDVVDGKAATAQAAAEAAQETADDITTYVGTFTHDSAKTVVEYINAKTDGIATSGNLEALAGRVTANEQAIAAINNEETGVVATAVAEAKAYVDEEDVFETDMATINALGGIAAGADLNGLTTHEVLKKLLYPYVDATVGNATASPNGGTYEKGATKTITSVSITVTKKSEPITSVELFNGSTSIEKKEGDAVKNGGTFTFSGLNVVVPTNGNQLTVKVTYPDANGNAKTVEKKTTALTFVYPYYMGTCAAGTAIDEALVESLTKKIEGKGNKSNSFTVSDGHMVFAYPKAHGVLKSILDPNNFETIGNYTRSEVSVTGLDGTAQTYYVYVSGATTVSGFTVNFKY